MSVATIVFCVIWPGVLGYLAANEHLAARRWRRWARLRAIDALIQRVGIAEARNLVLRLKRADDAGLRNLIDAMPSPLPPPGAQ